MSCLPNAASAAAAEVTDQREDQYLRCNGQAFEGIITYFGMCWGFFLTFSVVDVYLSQLLDQLKVGKMGWRDA